MNEIAFKHLGVKNGLSNSQISYITKDSKGFMWFSTSQGLNRYDGYSFKVFMHNSKDPYSLPDNTIEDVQENADGLLWVHTSRSGYVYYDPGKETFHPAGPLLQERYGIPDVPTRMYIDREKNIWSHGYNGTYYYNVEGQELTFYPLDEKLRERGINISCIAEDSKGVLFLYANGFFERVDRNTNEVTFRNNFLPDASGNVPNWSSMCVDDEGDYWIFGSTGLWLYYTGTDRWEHLGVRKDSPYVLSSDQVNDVKKDNQGRI